MEISYNYRGEKEEIICHTNMKKIDSVSLKVMQKCFETQSQTENYFLPVNITKEAEGYTFVYDMRGMTNLRAWLYEAAEKEQLRMHQEIMEKQQKIFRMGISQEQILTEERYMYVDEKTQHIKFICIPVMSEADMISEEKISESAYISESDIEYEAEPELPLTPPVPSEEFLDMEDKDSEFIVPQYPELFQDEEDTDDYRPEDEFSQDALENFFQESEIQLEKEKMDGSKTTLGLTPLNDMPLEEKKIQEEYLDTDIKENTGIDSEVLDSDGMDLKQTHVSESELQNIYTDDDEEKTILLVQKTADDGEDETILSKSVFQIHASLYRIQTRETVKLNKNINVVGKSKKRADIIIENNPTISRKHCTIYFEKGNYYLEDNGSLNGTWLEDEKLWPEEKFILHDKSKIRLSDEEFIFNIE